MRHNLGLDNPDEVSCEDRIDLLEEHLRRDNREVLITLALLKEEEGEVESARDLLEQARSHGEPHALFNLGVLLIQHALDPAQGARLVRNAAKNGDKLARKFKKKHLPKSAAH